jgi:hypothetical protein
MLGPLLGGALLWPLLSGERGTVKQRGSSDREPCRRAYGAAEINGNREN